MGSSWRLGALIWMFPVNSDRRRSVPTKDRNMVTLREERRWLQDPEQSLGFQLCRARISRVDKGLPLPPHVEHVQPGHRAELLPPEGVARHCAPLAVLEDEQLLVHAVSGSIVSLFLGRLLVEHAVV